MPFVPTFLPAADALRAIGGFFGLRPFVVTIRTRVWTGGKPGAGTFIDQNTKLTNQAADGSKQNVYVRQLTNQEVIASGGLYRARDLRIGPMTPAFAQTILLAAGYVDNDVDPATSASATEVFWNVTGPGMPSGGAWMDKVQEDASALHYFVVLRSTGRQP